MGNYTDIYLLYKPSVGERAWGTAVDQNFDKIEAALVDHKDRITLLEEGGGSPGSGHVIQDNGASLTPRSRLNFIGFDISDDLANNATVVVHPTSGGSGHTIQEAGTAVANRVFLNFMYLDISDDGTATIVGAPSGYWVPLANGDADDPGLVFAEGQAVMVFMEP